MFGFGRKAAEARLKGAWELANQATYNSRYGDPFLARQLFDQAVTQSGEFPRTHLLIILQQVQMLGRSTLPEDREEAARLMGSIEGAISSIPAELTDEDVEVVGTLVDKVKAELALGYAAPNLGYSAIQGSTTSEEDSWALNHDGFTGISRPPAPPDLRVLESDAEPSASIDEPAAEPIQAQPELGSA